MSKFPSQALLTAIPFMKGDSVKRGFSENRFKISVEILRVMGFVPKIVDVGLSNAKSSWDLNNKEKH